MQLRFGLRAALVLAVLLPATATAQRPCRVVGSVSEPVLQCLDLASCVAGSSCPGESAAEPVCRTPPGICGPRCSSLVECERDSNCVAGMVTGVCVPIATPDGPLAGTRFCDLPTSAYCRRPGDASVPEARFIACHTFPHSDTIAPAWGDGDCDADGCPNANDANPCDESVRDCTGTTFIDTTCGTRRTAPVGPEVCVLLGGAQLSCGARHHCNTALDCAQGFRCAAGSCEPPVCSTLYACRDDADCPTDGELPVALGRAVCVRPNDLFGPAPMPDGFCGFASFRAAACTGGEEGACAVTPEGALTFDFFQGDCDADGCPNGIDEAVCDAAVTGACGSAPSLACPDVTLMRVLRPDAGPDASDLDASLRDAGNAPPMDAPAGAVVSFAGGSGCICGVGHASPRGSLVLVLGLLLALVRRR